MADQWREPDEALQRQLEDSRRHWLSEGREGSPLLAPGADLRGLDLAERTLAEAQLQGADLREARLNHTILVRAALDEAQLEGAHLFGANGSRASLTQAILRNVLAQRSQWVRAVMIETQMQGADFSDADLRHAELIHADLGGAKLHRADLRSASLASATLVGADLTDANLDSTVIAPATLSTILAGSTTRGEPAVLEPSPSGSSPPDFRDPGLVSRVSEQLRSLAVARVHRIGPASGLPDLVLELPERRYLAISVHQAPDSGWLQGVSRCSDVVAVLDTTRTSGPTDIAVIRIDDLARWIKRATPNLSPLRGAIALAVRQLDRLTPYVQIARRARVDPSLISRLSVWLDSQRSDFLLPSGDRRLAESIPAHLAGAGLARGARWADTHLSELTEYEAAVRRVWRRLHTSDSEQAVLLAERGLRWEKELASTVASAQEG